MDPFQGPIPGPVGKLTAPSIPPASKGVIAGMILIPHENFQTLQKFSNPAKKKLFPHRIFKSRGVCWRGQNS